MYEIGLKMIVDSSEVVVKPSEKITSPQQALSILKKIILDGRFNSSENREHLFLIDEIDALDEMTTNPLDNYYPFINGNFGKQVEKIVNDCYNGKSDSTLQAELDNLTENDEFCELLLEGLAHNDLTIYFKIKK